MAHTGADLINELDSCLAEASEEVRQLANYGRRKAETECEYRCALAEKMLREREENKTPVTILSDVCRGNRQIALLKVKRDCAEAEYDACREAILLNKKRADVYREQISREWNQVPR